MQKKLLTMAVAGALAAPGVALAQASVEVYGFVHMAIGNWKYTEGTAGSPAAPSVSKWDVSSSASNVGVRGRETLGGGMTAWFQIETNAAIERSNNVAHTSGFASRNSAVGLQGGFGNVFLGQWTTPWADLDALWGVGTVGPWGPVTSIIGRRETTGAAPNMNCSNTGSGVGAAVGGNCDSVESGGGVGHPFWRRTSNSLFYQSPVFAGGAQAKVSWQPNQDKTPGNGTTSVQQDPQMWSASLQWAGMGGRARAGFAVDRHKDFTTVGKTDTGWRLVGGYNFGVVDIGLAYEEMKYQAALSECKAKQYAIAGAVPVGMGSIRASYSVAKDIEGTYATGAAQPATPAGVATSNVTCGGTVGAASPTPGDNGAKQYNIGYEHRFSKRTNAGIGYSTIKNDSAAGGNQFVWSGMSSTNLGVPTTVPNGVDVSTIFVSLIHRF